MRAIVRPGSRIEGNLRVPGDKSIAHRWLILATTADGRSVLRGLPEALDVRSTATCLAALSGRRAAVQLSRWAGQAVERELVVDAEGWSGVQASGVPLECGNSGTTMRLLAGALAGRDFDSTLMGDDALSFRPMERVASPLRRLGADVATEDGHAPVRITGRPLHGERIELETSSSQVKGAILFAGLGAEGTTTVVESGKTRDHTERALQALGAPASATGHEVSVSAFQHEGFEADLPGDPSSAIFAIAAAALTGGSLEIAGVGLNETRTHYLSALQRMGIAVASAVGNVPLQLGEDVGGISVEGGAQIGAIAVEAAELPLLIDDVVMLAVMAAFGPEGEESRFEGAGELRLKESDRLTGLAEGIQGLGGVARVEGDALVVGGGGLEGGSADARRDHRLAMAFAVGALAARSESRIDGMEWADVSFPGFVSAMRSLGANIEEA